MKRCIVLFSLLSLVLLSGCRTIETIVYKDRVVTDTLYQNKVHYDSIYIKEKEFVKGDTVFVFQNQFKYKYLTDTVYQSKTDSLVVYKKVTEYKKYIPNFYKIFTGIGIVLLLIIILQIAFKLYRKFRV